MYTGTFDMIDPKTGRSVRHKTGVLHFSAAHLGNYISIESQKQENTSRDFSRLLISGELLGNYKDRSYIHPSSCSRREVTFRLT